VLCEPPYREPTEMDIKEAAALASLFGIEPTEGFQRFVSFWMHGFAWDAIERARIGYRTRDDELWHDVLSRIAPGAAQAAAVCAAARRGELPSWHKWMVDGLLDEIGFELPRPDVHMTADDTALEITQAYQRLADHARSMLDQIGPRTRGRKRDGLDLFILMLVGIVQMDRPDMVKPAAFTEGVATALALAAHRAREELARRDDLSPDVREAVRRRLDVSDLSDDAIRNRIRIALAGLIEGRACQDHAANAIRANSRN
jgi:hypothetical protein